MQYWAQVTPDSGFSVLTHTRHSQAATLVLPPKQRTEGKSNASQADQWLYVLAGQGRAAVGNESVALGPGAFLLIEAGEPHEIKNSGDVPLEIIILLAPAVL